VQLTPLARFVGWAQFTRQNAMACWRLGNAQPSDVRWQTSMRGAPAVGHTRIAWHLPPAAVLHPSHACQRRR